MVDLIADPQWDAFLNTMIKGAGMLQPAAFDPVGGVMGIPPVGDEKDSSGGMGGMGGMDMQGMMGMFGGGGGGGAGAMGGGVGFAANGGTFPGGMPVVVGEQGPEVVMSQGNTSVIPLPPGSNVTQNLPYQPVPAGAGVHPGNIMQNMPYPAPQPGGGMDMNRMMQQLLMAQVAGNVKTAEPEQKKGFNWLMMIPGFAKGAAMATKMNQEKELLTLRKQQQQGQEAAVKMQQLEMMRKLQRQESMDKLGPMFGRLYSGDETMEDAERQQLEGIIFEELARNGSPEQLEKFQEQRIAARQQRLVRKAMGDDVEPQAPAPAGGGPSGGPAPSGGQPPAQQPGMRERLVLQGLEQELAHEEARMGRLRHMVTTKEGKEAYAAAEKRANELADRIDKIHSRGLTAEGHVIQREGQKQTGALTREGHQIQRDRLAQDAAKEARETSGVLSPTDKRKLELDIRRDIRQEPKFKILTQVQNGVQNVELGTKLNNAQGDLAIVNGVAKILDPESTVREGEFATIARAQGFLQRFLMLPATWMEGDRLHPTTRKSFLDLAQQMGADKTTAAETELRSVYEPIAKGAGLDFNALVPLPSGKKVVAPAATKPIDKMNLQEVDAEIKRLESRK